jgi:CBS domain containing-hemolysin-like protein
MTPVNRLIIVSPDQNATNILERMRESSTNYAVVVRESDVIGLVTNESITEYIHTNSELRTWGKEE